MAGVAGAFFVGLLDAVAEESEADDETGDGEDGDDEDEDLGGFANITHCGFS